MQKNELYLEVKEVVEKNPSISLNELLQEFDFIPYSLEKIEKLLNWHKMMLKQQKIANEPISLEESEKIHKQISRLFPQDLLEEFDI